MTSRAMTSRAMQRTEGSTDCAGIGCTLTGRMRPFEIDHQSQSTFQKSGNTSALNPRPGVPVPAPPGDPPLRPRAAALLKQV